LTVAPERCTKPSALTVGRNARFHSSQQKAARSTAKNALRSTDQEGLDKPSRLAQEPATPFVLYYEVWVRSIGQHEQIQIPVSSPRATNRH